VLFWPRGVRQTSTDSELLSLHVFARCLFFDSHIGAHPVSSVGEHSIRQLSGARLHWGRNQCADTQIYDSVEQNHSEIGAVTARIHAVSGVVLRLFSL
jgi:hypothetical protein